MTGRVFLIVMDSVGIGGAPDAVTISTARFQIQVQIPCPYRTSLCDGQSRCQSHRSPRVPHLRALGLGNAIELSANQNAPGIDPISGGTQAWHVKRPAEKTHHRAIGNQSDCPLTGPALFQKSNPIFSAKFNDILCKIAGSMIYWEIVTVPALISSAHLVKSIALQAGRFVTLLPIASFKLPRMRNILAGSADRHLRTLCSRGPST